MTIGAMHKSLTPSSHRSNLSLISTIIDTYIVLIWRIESLLVSFGEIRLILVVPTPNGRAWILMKSFDNLEQFSRRSMYITRSQVDNITRQLIQFQTNEAPAGQVPLHSTFAMHHSS